MDAQRRSIMCEASTNGTGGLAIFMVQYRESTHKGRAPHHETTR